MSDISLSHIERLVEFGLSMSVAQQMVNVMNNTMQSMRIPGATLGAKVTSHDWYVAKQGKATGPFDEKEIKNMLLNHIVTKDDLVWTYGMKEWAFAKDVPDIVEMLILLPPIL